VTRVRRLLDGFFFLVFVCVVITQPPAVGYQAIGVPRPRCQVTIPNGLRPPVTNFGGEVEHHRGRGVSKDESSGVAHGNGVLWVVLPAKGTLRVSPHRDGSLMVKFPWWRGIPGTLTILGRPIGMGKGSPRVWIPKGYGSTGFQASEVVFPGEGCWKITGKLGNTELSFVVEVRSR
jgi:hypothetical protein